MEETMAAAVTLKTLWVSGSLIVGMIIWIYKLWSDTKQNKEEIAKMNLTTHLFLQTYYEMGFGISEAVKVALSSVVKSFDFIEWEDDEDRQRAIDYFARASTASIKFLETGAEPGVMDLVSEEDAKNASH